MQEPATKALAALATKPNQEKVLPEHTNLYLQLDTLFRVSDLSQRTLLHAPNVGPQFGQLPPNLQSGHLGSMPCHPGDQGSSPDF